jgi:hypothetical protein
MDQKFTMLIQAILAGGIAFFIGYAGSPLWEALIWLVIGIIVGIFFDLLRPHCKMDFEAILSQYLMLGMNILIFGIAGLLLGLTNGWGADVGAYSGMKSGYVWGSILAATLFNEATNVYDLKSALFDNLRTHGMLALIATACGGIIDAVRGAWDRIFFGLTLGLFLGILFSCYLLLLIEYIDHKKMQSFIPIIVTVLGLIVGMIYGVLTNITAGDGAQLGLIVSNQIALIVFLTVHVSVKLKKGKKPAPKSQ